MIIGEIRQLICRTPVFTLANGLTLLRLVLLPPIYLLLRWENGMAPPLTVLLVCIGWLTDGLDGYAARRLGQITELGKILDPVVDKLFVLALLVFLILLRDFPLWFLAVIVPRDVLILWGGLYLARRRKTVEKSQLWGKITTNVLLATMVAYLLRWTALMPFFLTLAVLLSVISTWSYARFFFRALHEAA
jgi:CDP-diacylglycerol--glycerol-3-phosphate 3-phosphatidyltransferase